MPKKKRAKYTHGGLHIGNSIANLEISLRPRAEGGGEVEATATKGNWIANVAVPFKGNKGPSGTISRRTKKGWTFTAGGNKEGGGVSVGKRL